MYRRTERRDKIEKDNENRRNNKPQDKRQKNGVAAYCRVSTDSDAQLESLEAQKTHHENYINSRNDWEFAGLYYDEGITGTKKDKRQELLRLIDDCKSGRVDFHSNEVHQPVQPQYHRLPRTE